MTEAALGMLTSVGGYLEAGSLGTALQAGGAFGYRLLWTIVLGTICIASLVEMSGRLAAVSHHTIADAVRERFGFRLHSILLVGQVLLDVLVLTAEVGGVAFALHLATGTGQGWWAVPVGFGLWLLLWFGRFTVIENGVALLGLVTLSFVIAAVRARPSVRELASALLPTVPSNDTTKYLYMVVSTLGATISPYMVSFYGSGAVEEQWSEDHLRMNRLVAWGGMGFGSTVWIAVMIVAATVLGPQHITIERYDQAAGVLTPWFGNWGFWLFVASLGVGCFGAALELALDIAYVAAQGLGWNWGEDLRPRDDARFASVYTIAIAVAVLPMTLGIEPLTVTLFSMALTVVVLPFVVLPLLVIMNDERYLKQQRNGLVANIAVVVIVCLGALLAIVAIPLQFMGG